MPSIPFITIIKMTKTKSYSKTKSKKSKLYSQDKKKNNLKYCCPNTKVKSHCIHIHPNLNLTRKLSIKAFTKSSNRIPKYAITTLIFGGDGCLPGILLLGSSIRHFIPKAYEKYFTLCCMVTPDINKSTRDIILKIYSGVLNIL